MGASGCQGPLELLKLGPLALLKETLQHPILSAHCVFLFVPDMSVGLFYHTHAEYRGLLSVLEQNQLETYQAWVLGRTPPQQHTSALEEQRVTESANAQDPSTAHLTSHAGTQEAGDLKHGE